MLFKKSKTIESTSPIKSTKNEMELDWSAQDHACKTEFSKEISLLISLVMIDASQFIASGKSG
jgi:hypothetical protein